MSGLLAAIEERRIALGLSQRAVADQLGITQPHYSKVVGGLAALTPAMAEAMHAWIDGSPVPQGKTDLHVKRIRTLTRDIERKMRELNALVGSGGTGRRAPRPTRKR